MDGFINKVREHPEVSPQSLKQLSRIRQLKSEERLNRETMPRLEEETVSCSVHALLAFMFKRVACFMNRRPVATGVEDTKYNLKTRFKEERP